MAAKVVGAEVWESIGTANTNSKPGSIHKATVEFKWLWSLAQQEALRIVSNVDNKGVHRLEPDPEIRAKRIAGAYADLYFKSKAASQGKVQFYWAALAAFVVKDIYYAYKYTREEVLKGGAVNSVGNAVADAYDHALRTYAAFAKGNIWLFMDIYPWMWFVLEWGLKKDGSVDQALINAAAGARSWSTYQDQSKAAVQWLPFGQDWLGSCQRFVQADPIHAEAKHQTRDDSYVRTHLPKEAPTPFRLPQPRYWASFSGANDVLNAYRTEMLRVCADTAAVSRLEKVRNFAPTPQVMQAYGAYARQAALNPKGSEARKKGRAEQQSELLSIADHEQLNVLQPLIYDDAKLKETLDLNHSIGRRWGNRVTKYIELTFSSTESTKDADKVVRFDPPTGVLNQIAGSDKSLCDPQHRMQYVENIAKKFNRLMNDERSYMEQQLQAIRGWHVG